MLATSYSFVFRALPGLTVLFFTYYGTPSFGLYLGEKTAAILGLTLTSTAYTMEIIRASLRSVPIGQFEATRALGIPRWRALQRVILPIAMRVITPPLCSQFVLVLKSSSIASLVAVSELTVEAMGQIATTFRPMEFLLVVGATYLIIISVISGLQYQLERVFGLK